MTKIKICGLSRPEDIAAANQVLPDYIGFVFAPSRRQVDLEKAAALHAKLSQTIRTVGVFQNADPARIFSVADSGILDLVQLHGSEDETYIRHIREHTGLPVIKAVSVTRGEDIEKWQVSAADFLLLDHGTGGTGRSFDWRLVGQSLKPFFLAGGLHIGNIEEAIRRTRPYAVDISSGVETGGLKDYAKIEAIIRRIRNA